MFGHPSPRRTRPRWRPAAPGSAPGARVGGPGASSAVAAVDTGGAGSLALLRDLVLLVSLADGGSGGGSGGGPGGASGTGGSAPTRSGERPEGSDRVAALVELAQQGDAEAFGQLYSLYVDTVYRYVYARVGSRATAEDLTSETFVRALRRLDSFSWQGRDIAAWFITIARNLVMDNAKSARFRLEVSTGEMFDADEHEPAPDLEVLDRLRDRRLVEAVRTLKPDQAECVVLRFFQGLSLAEVALAMGRSEGAVKQLQLRAVRSLARELGDELR